MGNHTVLNLLGLRRAEPTYKTQGGGYPDGTQIPRSRRYAFSMTTTATAARTDDNTLLLCRPGDRDALMGRGGWVVGLVGGGEIKWGESVS